ncbi:VIT domain-containing protein [Actinomadura roseirufa]|uniref:VIT domain-containing protein n=1 Tax=Actinomadura roseirufa TaxID=2094049 RepID=UPI0010417F84|nr:VIT domain-containing protein [Actinomadura roseirufa]
MTVRILPLPDTPTPPDGDHGLGALTTGRGNLPLDSVHVHAAITGLAAGLEVVQGFRNPFDVPLEATYVFPLPDRAAVTGLRMEAADRTVEGTLKERGAARRDYADAVAAGRRAAIAEEDRPDVFTMRVGNILPGERVTIRITLDQPLPYETGGSGAGAATFRFPLVVAPRYIPGTPLDGERAGSGVADDTDAVPDASRISPPVLLPGFPNPVQLSITADVDPAGLPLTGIRSALHVVAEDSDGGRTTVRLRPGERLDRDFVLRMDYDPHESAALSLVPDESGDEGTFTLTVLPSGESRPAPRDVVLVLDRSGSMQGWKMVAARRAAARIVDTFRAEDRFAVLSFDTVVERPRDLGSGLAAGTDRNRFRAVEHLAALGARGGTEMLAPLDEACTLLADSTRDRVLVLITDGQIGNEDQILAHLAPRLQGVRVHTVGIDRAVNAGFLTRLAAAGQGRCELVESEDRLDEAMEQIHHRIGAPIATHLALHADGLRIDAASVAPARLGALFPGVPLVIAGRFRGAPSGALSVQGTGPGGALWEQRATGTIVGDRAAASIWARAHLRDLEDRYTIGGADDLERRIVDTSLRFGVLCRFTAFVAVDSRVVTDGDTPHQAVQPVEVPDGWATPAVASAAAAPLAAFRPGGVGAARPKGRPGGGAGHSAPGPRAAFASADDFDTPDFMSTGAPAAPAGPPPPPGIAPAAPAAPAYGGPPMPQGGPPRPPRATPGRQARRAPAGRLATILEGLQRVPDDPEQRLNHLTGELLPALDTLIGDLETRSLDLTAVSALRDELRTLRPGTDAARVNDLWARALRVLTDLGHQPLPSRRPFWKRNG